jgi:hypothetical protein
VTVKRRRCRHCRDWFVPILSLAVACSLECAKALAEAKRIARGTDRERREKLKSRSDWLKEAQAAFNAWIRWRDRDLPCISCGRHHAGAYDAGHYISVGANATLRFHEDNCHKQCVPCNQHKSGNAVLYRLGLVERIGLDRVCALECWHDPRPLSIEDIIAIRDDYRQRLKMAKKSQNSLD